MLPVPNRVGLKEYYLFVVRGYHCCSCKMLAPRCLMKCYVFFTMQVVGVNEHFVFSSRWGGAFN